jgi:hypothetical protein
MPRLADVTIRYHRIRVLLVTRERLLTSIRPLADGLIWIFLLTAACCSGFLWTHPAWSQQQVGIAEIIRLDVEATRELVPEPIVLEKSYPMLQNDRIRTPEDSAALLVFQDNTGIYMAPVADLTLDEVAYNPENPEKSRFEVALKHGVIRVRTGELKKYASKIVVWGLDHSASAALQSTATITVSARGSMTVSVAEGSATVTSAGRTVTVAAGQSTLVLQAASPTPPVPSPPAPPIVVEMDRLLQAASLQNFGTRAAARSPAVEAPSDAGTRTFSPNVDGKIQSEIAGGVSRGTHEASRGTH